MENLKDNAQPASDYRGKWIQATVTNNIDPNGTARIQIKVPGLVEDDPWAAPDTVDGGGGGGDATQDIPAVNSQVYVKLQDGKVNFPLYRGAVVKPGGLPSPLNGDPNLFGWIRGATSWVLDKTTGEATYTGPQYTMHIDASGNVTVKGNGGLDVTYTKAKFNIPTTEFTGDVTVDGNLIVKQTLTVTGATTVNGGFTSNGGTGGGSNVAVFNGPITTTNNLHIGGNLQIDGSGNSNGNFTAPNIH